MRASDVGDRNAEQVGDSRGGVGDERRLVAFSALRHRRQIRTIGLKHDRSEPTSRTASRSALRVGKGQHAADPEQEAELVDVGARLFGSSGEAMHDAAHPAFPALAQNGGEIFERIALMKDDRHAGFARDVELRAQHLGLDVARAVIVIIVEAGLADRDDVCFVQKREQLGSEVCAERCVLRADECRRRPAGP